MPHHFFTGVVVMLTDMEAASLIVGLIVICLNIWVYSR